MLHKYFFQILVELALKVKADSYEPGAAAGNLHPCVAHPLSLAVVLPNHQTWMELALTIVKLKKLKIFHMVEQACVAAVVNPEVLVFAIVAVVEPLLASLFQLVHHSEYDFP